MVELIIKIPESEIPKRQEIIEMPIHFIDGKVCEAGGYEFDVLPKGHGRLGDLDKIIKEMQNYYDDCAKTSEYTRLGFETIRRRKNEKIRYFIIFTAGMVLGAIIFKLIMMIPE